MSEVGWIGAGRMGAAMARRLLAAGHGVHVWNRTRGKAEALAGARVADAVVDLAGLAVVFTTVADDASLLRVTLGEDGLLRGPVSPRYLVDASTVAAETSERVRQFAADRGTTLLAAPISGNPKVSGLSAATPSTARSPSRRSKRQRPRRSNSFRRAQVALPPIALAPVAARAAFARLYLPAELPRLDQDRFGSRVGAKIFNRSTNDRAEVGPDELAPLGFAQRSFDGLDRLPRDGDRARLALDPDVDERVVAQRSDGIVFHQSQPCSRKRVAQLARKAVPRGSTLSSTIIRLEWIEQQWRQSAPDWATPRNAIMPGTFSST